MGAGPYDALAAVYEWLIPDALLEPEGAAAAFAGVVDLLEPGARILDCAAGTGQLAVGLARRGFDVVASDASAAMLARARRLARDRGVDLQTVVGEWADLDALGLGPFDAVFCIGNSLAHAAGQPGRRAALAGMGAVLRPGGLLAVTARNWELVRAAGSGLRIADRLVSRAGRPGLVISSWHIAEGWDDPHHVEIAVVLLGEDAPVTSPVSPHVGRLTFWPFRHRTLRQDLRACGFAPIDDTYDAGAERYLVSARRR